MTTLKDNNDSHENQRPKLNITINEKGYAWEDQYITGAQIRQLAGISKVEEVFLAIKRPWDDELIKDLDKVDLARPGIEHFYSKKPGEHKLVTIHINKIEYKVTKGKHTVVELKSIGNVPLAYELEEVIDEKLTPLDDNATILIKGGEKFFGHVREGQSS